MTNEPTAAEHRVAAALDEYRRRMARLLDNHRDLREVSAGAARAVLAAGRIDQAGTLRRVSECLRRSDHELWLLTRRIGEQWHLAPGGERAAG